MKYSEYEKERNKMWARLERHYHILFSVDFRLYMQKLVTPFGDDADDLNDLEQSTHDIVVGALKLFPDKDKSSGNIAKSGKRRRKHFERRLYLVNFVLDCWGRTGQERIPWQQIELQWNNAHPSDRLDKPVLKAEYYRAISDRDLIIQLLPTRKWHYLDIFKYFITRLQKHYGFDQPSVVKTLLPWIDAIEVTKS